MKRTGIVIAALVLVLATVLWTRRDQLAEKAPVQPSAPEVETSLPQNSAEAIRQRLAMSRPATSGGATGTTTNVPTTNLLQRLLSGKMDPPNITREQAEAFANAGGRKAEALLAAWRASGDRSFLREAMEKFPGDPRVAFMAWAQAGVAENPDASRREWLQKFQNAAPDNALADYLAAREHMKAGDVETGLREITAAQNKRWQDYVLDGVQNTEEAYRAAGYSETEAKAIATMGALLPHLADLKGLGITVTDLATKYRAAGDTASADAAMQWALHVGTRLEEQGTSTLLQQLVAIAIERYAYKTLDPNYVLGDSGLTAQQQIEALDKRRAAIRDIARDSDNTMRSLSDADLASYFDRLKLFGEAAAVQWAKSRVAGSQ